MLETLYVSDHIILETLAVRSLPCNVVPWEPTSHGAIPIWSMCPCVIIALSTAGASAGYFGGRVGASTHRAG